MMLGKILVVCTIVLLIPALGLCMDFAFSLKGGIGFPFFSGSGYQDLLDFGTSQVEEYGTYYRTRFLLSYTLGASAEIGFFSFLSLQPEVLVSWAGGAYGFPENINLYSYTEFIRTTYVELPVLLKIRINMSPGSSYWRRVTLFAGPGAAFKLSNGKVESRVDGEEATSEKLSADFLTDRYYFLLFGIGYERARHSNRRFTSFELRYHRGMESIINPDSGIDDFIENNVQFVIGIAFGTGPGR